MNHHDNSNKTISQAVNVGETPPAKNLVEAKQTTMTIYILHLVGIVVPLLPLVGLIMAIIKRKEMAGTIYYNHMTYLIRTFVISLIGLVIGFITTFILIGFLLLFLTGIWSIFRIIYGFVQFQNDKDVDPIKWFIA